MNVLITLPKHLLDKIISGKKKYEMRKCLPKNMKLGEDGFAHIVGCLVQDIVANEHMPEEEKQPTKFFVEKYYKKLRKE